MKAKIISKTKRIPERLPDITADFFNAGLNVKNWAVMHGYAVSTVRPALGGFQVGRKAMAIRNKALESIEVLKSQVEK